MTESDDTANQSGDESVTEAKAEEANPKTAAPVTNEASERAKKKEQIMSRDKEQVSEACTKNPIAFKTISRSDTLVPYSENQKAVISLAMKLKKAKSEGNISEDEILAVMAAVLNEKQLGKAFEAVEPEPKKAKPEISPKGAGEGEGSEKEEE